MSKKLQADNIKTAIELIQNTSDEFYGLYDGESDVSGSDLISRMSFVIDKLVMMGVIKAPEQN